MAKTYSNKELENILEERYGEKFKIVSNQFIPNLAYHQFKAELKSNNAIIIHGTYAKAGSEVSDNYPQMLHTYQCSQLIEEKLNKYYKDFRFKTNVSFSYNKLQTHAIPRFESIIHDESVQGSVDLQLYLFNTVNEDNKNEVLEGIVEVMKDFKSWENKSFNISIKFWEDGHFEDNKLENVKFGFNVYREEFYDSIPVENQFIKQVIYCEFDTKKATPAMSVDLLYSNLHPFEKGKGLKHKLVNFN